MKQKAIIITAAALAALLVFSGCTGGRKNCNSAGDDDAKIQCMEDAFSTCTPAELSKTEGGKSGYLKIFGFKTVSVGDHSERFCSIELHMSTIGTEKCMIPENKLSSLTLSTIPDSYCTAS